MDKLKQVLGKLILTKKDREFLYETIVNSNKKDDGPVIYNLDGGYRIGVGNFADDYIPLTYIHTAKIGDGIIIDNRTYYLIDITGTGLNKKLKYRAEDSSDSYNYKLYLEGTSNMRYWTLDD